MEPSSLAKLNESELLTIYTSPTWYSGLGSYDDFDIYEKVAWMQKNWSLSVYASILYTILIFGGQEVMKRRKAFDLRIAMTIWNFTLAAFSISTIAVLLPEFFMKLTTHGLYTSICGTVDIVSTKSLYWGYLFVMSKMVELGDTAFIVLRKRKLIFLHWYHHMSVLVCVWLSSKSLMSTGAWFAVVNCTVHAVMYTYFGLTSMGFKVPRLGSMLITTTQINQMVIGLGVNCYALWAKMSGISCAVTNFHIQLVFGMYLSYLILFGNFFYKTYFLGEEKGAQKKIN